MMIPNSYITALLLAILTMLCWGSWANTQKLTGKWRFELFYFDYALGVLLTALVAAFTFGSMGEGLSFLDNMAVAMKRYFLLGFSGGVVFNLANMLLVAAISVAGLAVAFPIGIGLALVVGVIWNYFLAPAGSPLFLFLGSALVVSAIVVDAIAYRAHARERVTAKGAKSTKMTARGLVLSLISGALMGSFYPLVQMGMTGDLGLGPYAIGVVFAAGVFLSTFVFNLYFINLPVVGQPVRLSDYFTGTKRQHLLGILGGVIWCTGTLANFVAASAPKEVNVGPAISYALGQGATMISALWGLLVWKEFAGASSHVRRLLTVMLVLFAIGLGLVSVAPLRS